MTIDCVDGTDEAECKNASPTYFHCGSEGNTGRAVDPCIPKEKRCDGYLDCRSGKDKVECPGVPRRLDQFRCANGARCIETSQKCDHKNDCGDNTDQLGCNFPLCHGGQFRRANQLCIPMGFHCDGY